MLDEFEKMVSHSLVEKLINKFYSVHNDLGYGFLERVYQNALYYAILDEGLKCEAEKEIKVFHNGRIVGEYRADLIVEDCIILELKACEDLNPAHEAQLINYLKASEIEVGYLFIFGKSARYRRKVYSNKRKNLLIKK